MPTDDAESDWTAVVLNVQSEAVQLVRRARRRNVFLLLCPISGGLMSGYADVMSFGGGPAVGSYKCCLVAQFVAVPAPSSSQVRATRFMRRK
jgi:hypothetical protein